MEETQPEQTKAEQKIVQYLHEAHAAETFVAQTLAAHIAMTPASRYRDGLETHLRETRNHADRIQRLLAKRESQVGYMKLGYGLVQGVASQAAAVYKAPFDLVRGMSPEEKLLKNAKDEIATEAREIACYVAIEQLAREVGDQEVERLAASIRKDEENMLKRLLDELPRLTTDVVAAEVEGKSVFVFGRTGAVDAVRTVASAAASTVSRTANRTARRVRPEEGPAQPNRKPVRKPRATTDAKPRNTKRNSARKTTTRKTTTRSRSTTTRSKARS